MWQTSLLCLCDINFCLCKGNCAECSGAHAPAGFEIYFYVQLPLGQPQDLVWLPIEYFVCPSSCPSSSQETNTGS